MLTFQHFTAHYFSEISHDIICLQKLTYVIALFVTMEARVLALDHLPTNVTVHKDMEDITVQMTWTFVGTLLLVKMELLVTAAEPIPSFVSVQMLILVSGVTFQ